MGQAEQPRIFDRSPDDALAMADGEIARLEALRQALEDRILRLSKIAEDMDAAAQAFAGASLSMDLRSPSLTTGRARIRYAEMKAEGAFQGLWPELAEEQAQAMFILGWSNAATEPIPDGPELPQDAQTWAKMRRALKLGRPLARLAREVAEGIGELGRAAKA